MTHPARLSAGGSALGHILLLARGPDRILALRLALSAAIGPASVVLDAGCGSLGVLSIMAARLGARRVVAVDTGRLDVARALAAENGVAGRIEFLERDLTELPADAGSFDAILGMVYYNDPRRDLAQQQLMAGLARRFAHAGTAFIPGIVRYSVTGYDSASPDPGERSQRDRWDSAVSRAEALTGLSMVAIRQFPGTDYSVLTQQLSSLPGGAADVLAARRNRTLLTSRELFTEVRYAEPATAGAYPPELALTVTGAGRLDTTIWRQELMAGDLLIRRTDTTHPVTPPCEVQPGDTAVLATEGGWGEAIPLTVRRGGRTA
jgi:SAM-dependent methyltransferase